jgi:monofunctional biosynthetic peptidoglycan transglycosylase
MPMAVIASEDNLFPTHHGFDVVQIQKAVEEHLEGGRTRGASTISQQTAKNVFLWPASNLIRKGFEAYFTFMIETFWSKQRIMEVYLNSIEMGRGLYGVQATAKYNFGTTAAELTKGQCALIAATLPNPLIFDSANPSPYMLRRKNKIMHIMSLLPKFPPVEKGMKTYSTTTKHHHHHHHHSN